MLNLTFNILKTQSSSVMGSGIGRSPINMRMLEKHSTASLSISSVGNFNSDFSRGTYETIIIIYIMLKKCSFYKENFYFINILANLMT